MQELGCRAPGRGCGRQEEEEEEKEEAPHPLQGRSGVSRHPGATSCLPPSPAADTTHTLANTSSSIVVVAVIVRTVIVVVEVVVEGSS